jgi:hypothetical protein
MKAAIPWLPARVRSGAATEVCPGCGAKTMIPWTLRRDRQRMTLLRTWVCATCQITQEREEAEPQVTPSD